MKNQNTINMIQLNHTDRENVKPLSNDELEGICSDFTQGVIFEDDVQNLISSYQNLQHFWDVAGGWEGLNALQKQSECNVTEAEHSALGYPNFNSDIYVEYEIVKGV